MGRHTRSLAAVLAAITCPCHVPLLAVLLTGTWLGGVIAEHLGLLVAAFALLFGGALWLWFRQPIDVAVAAPPRPPTSPAASDTASQDVPLQVSILATPGCRSCVGVERSWAALRPDYGGWVQMELVDLLEQPELASRYGVRRSPAVVIDGRLRAQGALDAARLRRLLDEALRERGVAAVSEDGAHA